MQNQSAPTIPAQLLAIPSGDAGTKVTLAIMRRMARRYKKSVPLRQLALNIIRDLPTGPSGKNFFGQVERIQDYVRNNIQYVRDINGVETVQTPDRTLDNRAGDCDDQSLLVATLLETIGHRTRFVAIKMSVFGPFVHVFAETKIGRRWLPVETTENWPVGMHPPKFSTRYVVHN